MYPTFRGLFYWQTKASNKLFAACFLWPSVIYAWSGIRSLLAWFYGEITKLRVTHVVYIDIEMRLYIAGKTIGDRC